MSDTMHSGNTSMFGIFFLTIATLGLVAYTFYHLCATPEDGGAVAWLEKVRGLEVYMRALQDGNCV